MPYIVRRERKRRTLRDGEYFVSNAIFRRRDSRTEVSRIAVGMRMDLPSIARYPYARLPAAVTKGAMFAPTAYTLRHPFMRASGEACCKAGRQAMLMDVVYPIVECFRI